MNIWRPILDLLEEKVGVKFKLVGSVTIPSFEQEFVSGKFDFAYMNPYHSVVARKAAGFIPIVKDIKKQLYGIIVVPKNSSIKSVEQLENKVIAFPSPNALGACLIPRAIFYRDYNKMKFTPRYVQTHSSVYLNVLLKKADAGGGVQKTFEKQSPAIRDKLKIIWKTPKIAPHPVVVHPRVSKKLRDRVIQAFLEIGKDQKGKELLSRVPIKEIGRASIDDYQPLKKMNLDEFYQN